MAIDKVVSASITDGTIATADIADGAVTEVKTTNVGGNNKPYFHGRLNANQDVSSGSGTLAQFTPDLDTASGWDSSNYRWVVPSGEAGKYYISMTLQVESATSNAVSWAAMQIWKNSDAIFYAENKTTSGNSGTDHTNFLNTSGVFDLAVGDQIKFYGTAYVTSGQARFVGGTISPTMGTIFKIIE
jgi:hypothetical protein